MLRLVFLILFLLTACENPVKRAVRETQYSAYEMVGIEKRDLLKRRIAQTRDNQKEATQTFENALDRLRTLYSLESSKLEREYRQVQSSYERSEAKAKDVRESRERMETVAADLFREWAGEIDEIQTPSMKSASRSKLNEARTRFEALDRSLLTAERKMQPVLTRLKDHVLYLKHNLNAESLSALKKEHDRIQGDIESLIRDMNKAVAQAEESIRAL